MKVKEILEVADEFEEVYVSDPSVAEERCPLVRLKYFDDEVPCHDVEYYGEKEVAKIQVPESYPELLIIHIKEA